MTYVIMTILGTACLFLAYWLGKKQAKYEDIHQHNEDLEDEAQEHANTPHTDDDFNKRMQSRIDSKD